MSKFSDIKKELSNLEALERELHLKQLQINRLLTITQAINNNVSAQGLYDMYNSFLSWEMGVKKMALYVLQNGLWKCTSSIGISEELIQLDISDRFPNYQRLKNIDEDKDHPLISEFAVVIPVMHKKSPIAYTFIGGFDRDEDMYNKVQFITTITNIIAVAIENKRLFKQQIEQERYKREMELASEMQRLLIPAVLPSGKNYELASVYRPHLGVGGDYFDVVDFDEDIIAFCIADISGKGIAAALLMSNFQANFHTLIKERSELEIFIRDLNESLFRITQGEKFLTFFVAEFNKKTRVLEYINAGHNPPVMVMNQQAHFLTKGCTILGSFHELPEIELGRVTLDGEALILTFTDGLTDIKNDEEIYFSEELLQQFALQNSILSASEFNESLMEHIEKFKGQQSYPDDVAILTCKIHKD
ncbi:MAG: PP2C family protein-serine/threonine phosphatase [Bacteroidota bacterium]